MALLYSRFPMLLLLHLLLHLSPLLASSFSLSHQLTPIPTTQIYLARRTLLSKIQDEQAPPLSNNKKPPKLHSDEDVDDDDDSLKTKKNKSSSGQDNQVSSSNNNKKKKSSASSDQGEEESLQKKEKKSTSSTSLNDEEESVNKKKNKKKSSASLNDDGGESIKKKKSSASLDDAKQGSFKKKKDLDDEVSLKKKKSADLIKTKPSSAKNQSSSSSTKQNKSSESSSSSKNKNKLTKTSKDEEDDSTQSNSASVTKTKIKKLDSTKASSNSVKSKSKMSTKSKAPPSPADNSEDDDFISEFRDMPVKFQQTIIPDLHRISTTSKMYLTKANKEMTKGFKPYVGVKYAPSVATGISVAFILLPLLMVSLVFNKIKAYFSLQRLLIFIQIYLSIYFSILCFSSLLTGLDPLKFFYATSQSTYIWLQVLQTLGYVLYLLLLLMYLILVFSTDTLLAQKFLGLAQTIVGFAVGLHYYMTVFHRVVLRQPPKTNWKVHAIYATSFLLISLFATADRRKKAYLQEGGEQGKNS